MTKVRITKRYTDVVLNQRIEAGTIREVTEERAEALVTAGVAEILEIVHEVKEKLEKKPRKTTAKKTTKKTTGKRTRKTSK